MILSALRPVPPQPMSYVSLFPWDKDSGLAVDRHVDKGYQKCAV